MNTDLFNLIVWAIIGVLNLIAGNITRTSYAIMWVMLMLQLIENRVVG